MKSTLILLFSFCLTFTSYAKLDTLYTQENGMITIKIVETPDSLVVLKQTSLNNPTEKTFSNEEVKILISGGVVVKKSTFMKSIFPPTIADFRKEFRVVNDVVVSQEVESPQDFSWLFLLLGMILPFVAMVLTGLKIPKTDTKPFLFSSVGIIIIIASIFTMVSFPLKNSWAFELMVSLGLFVGAVISFWFGRPLLSVALTIFPVGFCCIIAAKGNFGFQYLMFVITASVISFIIRYLYFKQKEKKTLVQTV